VKLTKNPFGKSSMLTRTYGVKAQLHPLLIIAIFVVVPVSMDASRSAMPSN